MSNDEQGPPSGSVPNAYRNALFWRWVRQMPKGLPSSFVNVLYALAAAADPSGRVRFRDGKPIRIKDIAAACKADEKDVRRYLDAAIAAGVVGIQGKRRRGAPALYVLLLSPKPVWDAAVYVLDSSKRKSRKAPPWLEEEDENGGVSPELSEPENGGHAPELTDGTENEVRGTRPRLSSGDTPPFGSGDTPPNNPGVAKRKPQERDEVVGQPQVDGADRADKIDSHDKPGEDPPGEEREGFARCARCHDPMIRRPGRDVHAHCEPRPVQGAFLIGLHGGALPPPRDRRAQIDAAIEADYAQDRSRSTG